MQREGRLWLRPRRGGRGVMGRHHSLTSAYGVRQGRWRWMQFSGRSLKNKIDQIFKTDTSSNFNLIKYFHPITHAIITRPSFLSIWKLLWMSEKEHWLFYSKWVNKNETLHIVLGSTNLKTSRRGQINKKLGSDCFLAICHSHKDSLTFVPVFCVKAFNDRIRKSLLHFSGGWTAAQSERASEAFGRHANCSF